MGAPAEKARADPSAAATAGMSIGHSPLPRGSVCRVGNMRRSTGPNWAPTACAQKPPSRAGWESFPIAAIQTTSTVAGACVIHLV